MPFWQNKLFTAHSAHRTVLIIGTLEDMHVTKSKENQYIFLFPFQTYSAGV